MSDLSATQCGCNNGTSNNSLFGGNGCSTLIWLIILLAIFGNNDDGCGNGIGLFNNNGNGCGCSSLIWLILILSCCGNF